MAKVEELWRQARADARFYGHDDVQLADSNTGRADPYWWADPHWTANAAADRPYWRRWSHRWHRPIRWYGGRTAATSAGTNDHVGPWRPVGTSRFN